MRAKQATAEASEGHSYSVLSAPSGQCARASSTAMGKRFGELNSISALLASAQMAVISPGPLCGISQSLQATWGTQTFLPPSTCQWPPSSPSFPQPTWSQSRLHAWPAHWSSSQKQCSCKTVQLLSADKAQSVLQSFDDTLYQLRMWKKNPHLVLSGYIGKLTKYFVGLLYGFQESGEISPADTLPSVTCCIFSMALCYPGCASSGKLIILTSVRYAGFITEFQWE